MPINTLRWNRLRYNAYAMVYDLPGRFFTPYRQHSLTLTAIQPGERVLLVGAATGLDLELLPPGCVISAIDYSPVMIARLKQRAEKLGLSVDARVMNAEAMDYASEGFDVIVLHLILAVLPDPYACWREAERVLVPGGRVTIFDKFLPDGAEPSALRSLFNGLTNIIATDINRRLGDITAGSPMVKTYDEAVLWGDNCRVVGFTKPVPDHN